MPGVYRSYAHAFQFFETGISRCQVVGEGVERWFLCVFEQVAAEEVSNSGQDSYGAF